MWWYNKNDLPSRELTLYIVISIAFKKVYPSLETEVDILIYSCAESIIFIVNEWMDHPSRVDGLGAPPFADWINLLFQASCAHSPPSPSTF